MAGSAASALPLLGDGRDISSSVERRLGDRIRRHAVSTAWAGHIDASIIDTRHRQIEVLLKDMSQSSHD